MHPITFLLKRAYLSTRGFCQKLLRDARVRDMTPARFDIMCFIRQGGIRLGGEPGKTFGLTTQRAIQRGLGLHPSTVSKMLKRLEALGWIERGRDFDDARVKTVQITALGLRQAWVAMRRIFRSRSLLRNFEMLARWLHPTRHVLEGVKHVVETLDLIACACDDEAYFYYEYGDPETYPFALVAKPRFPRSRTPREPTVYPGRRPGTKGWDESIHRYVQRWRAIRALRKLGPEPDATP